MRGPSPQLRLFRRKPQDVVLNAKSHDCGDMDPLAGVMLLWVDAAILSAGSLQCAGICTIYFHGNTFLEPDVVTAITTMSALQLEPEVFKPLHGTPN